MEDPEQALVDLTLAASTLKLLANTVVTDPEGIRLAESLLFVARGLGRSYDTLRPMVVNEALRRTARPPAPVVMLREEPGHG